MELRKDPLTGDWIAFAPERAARPFEHAPRSSVSSLDRCPFCRGNEELTPEAILQFDRQGQWSDEWDVRVIPNHYPILSADNTCPVPEEAGFKAAVSFGRHEVIVETPDHCTQMSQLSEQQCQLLMGAYRERFATLQDDSQIAHAFLFKNQGAGAGASLEHVHSQLVATPFLPRNVNAELATFARHFSESLQSYLVQLLDQELRTHKRIVFESDTFVVFSPYASRFPYETWIVPKRHQPHFTDANRSQLLEAGSLLHRTLTALENVLPHPTYNLALCSAPFHDERRNAWHWSIRAIPRIAGVAGYEVGTGNWINIVMPEAAAAEMREQW